MPANIVDVVCRVREHDHTLSVLLIKADEGVIAAGAAVLPDNFAVELLGCAKLSPIDQICLAGFAPALLCRLHRFEQW
jgi:hypothetical protein